MTQRSPLRHVDSSAVLSQGIHLSVEIYSVINVYVLRKEEGIRLYRSLLLVW